MTQQNYNLIGEVNLRDDAKRLHIRRCKKKKEQHYVKNSSVYLANIF